MKSRDSVDIKMLKKLAKQLRAAWKVFPTDRERREVFNIMKEYLEIEMVRYRWDGSVYDNRAIPTRDHYDICCAVLTYLDNAPL